MQAKTAKLTTPTLQIPRPAKHFVKNLTSCLTGGALTSYPP